MNKNNPFLDGSDGYGAVSRSLHWLMVVLFVWQFITTILRFFAKDTAIYNLIWPTHFQVGFALFLLVLIRGVWGLLNLSRRPHKSGVLGKLAGLGHLVIYGLMFVVPAVAVLRSYGNGRGFSFLGIQIFERTGVPNTLLTAPAIAVHGLLGWLLLAAIVGHVLMVFVHHFAMRDNTLELMTGRRVAREAK
ncbi:MULTISPECIES: cytochrome b [Ochrobactrum]|uniref:Cytochrome b n=1 Tax=Ochrobactrum chromiisoli TaxID=2993941 RepID=A0ABT3QS27_9HYPH|nr:cytochrome b [Ochrobactrum chromiisoli]MCX2698401.1 cytochrome b [Ochrobactrum chromiisoli]